MFEHRGLLEFAPDAGVRDLRFGEAQEVDVLPEEGAARIGARFAGDDVHHGSFAGAVRADDAAQLAGFDGERKRVERLEAVEADADVFEIEDRAVPDRRLRPTCRLRNGLRRS
jgi:hypothetical protein